MTYGQKFLALALAVIFLAPVVWCFGDIADKQAGVHYFSTALYVWSILMALSGVILLMVAGETWGKK